MKIWESIPHSRVYRFGIIYIIVFTLIAAVSNYFTWHKQFTSEAISILVTILMLLMWIALYMPIPIFIKKAEWKLIDFGFVVNKKTIILCAAIALLLIIRIGINLSFNYFHFALIEAIARVGEEVFYRGFIYAIVLRLLCGRKKSNLWAVIISSLVFAIMHTQTFLPSNPYTMQGMFINALILGALRYLTGSVLPGIIIHCVSNAGTVGMIFGILIYFLFVAFDYLFIRNKDLNIKTDKIRVPGDTNQ